MNRPVTRSQSAAQAKKSAQEITPSSWIGPRAKVTPSISEDENARKVFFAEAATYSFHFLLRVFPMISEDNLKEIFSDRYVYTLLLSHNELVLIKVDVSDFLREGIPTCYYSETFSAEGEGSETNELMCWQHNQEYQYSRFKLRHIYFVQHNPTKSNRDDD